MKTVLQCIDLVKKGLVFVYFCCKKIEISLGKCIYVTYIVEFLLRPNRMCIKAP